MFEKAIGTINAAASFRHRYDNFIGGRWSAPASGEYFADKSPINGAQIAEFALSTPEDVERALDAAHAARDQWARIAPAERARILNRVADRLEDNLELLALAETIEMTARRCVEMHETPDELIETVVALRPCFSETIALLDRDANPLAARRPGGFGRRVGAPQASFGRAG